MTTQRLFAAALLSFTLAGAEDAPAPAPAAGVPEAIKGADAHLLNAVRTVEDRIAGIVESKQPPGLLAVRADDVAREAEAASRALGLLGAAAAAARGRAWRDLGLGVGSEPAELLAALERDLPGMTFDASRKRLLVDPARLPDDVAGGDPDNNPDASILLATGVAPDEPVAGHYIAHALLDGRPLEGPATTDAILARAALAEGSANLASLLLLFGGAGLEAEVVAGSLRPEDALGGRLVPAAMRSSGPVVSGFLEFVYLDGFAQAAALARRGGFHRLAQERGARRATRDVIHVDRPAASPAAIPETPLPASSGLILADHDALGEQGIVALVSLITGKDNLGMIAGDGWIADALWRYEPASPSTPAADAGATVWVTRWASEEDAKDFEYAMERCLQARFPGETLAEDGPGARILRRPDRVYRLAKDGTEVTVRVLTAQIEAKLAPAPKKKPAARPSTSSKK